MDITNAKEEEILLLQKEVFKLYRTKYRKQIAERLKQWKDPEWKRLREEKGYKLNYIQIAFGKEFINIRINDKGEVIGRQHFKYGFDMTKELK